MSLIVLSVFYYEETFMVACEVGSMGKSVPSNVRS